MNIIKASDFKTRSELENKVRNVVGLTPDMKPEWKISGTLAELAQLHLSASTIFWGITCEVTDLQVLGGAIPPAIDRGEFHESGLNGISKSGQKIIKKKK